MIDYATRQSMVRKAARDSQRNHEVPGIWHGTENGFKIPFLGDRIPRGWKRTNRAPLFVDSSGFGDTSEPALTQDQFFKELTIGMGYAVIEAGQFQVYVAEYTKPWPKEKPIKNVPSLEEYTK